MNKRKFLALGLSSLLVASLVLASCGPAPVVEEPVVEEPVVEEPVVEEPVVEEPAVEEPVVEEPVVEVVEPEIEVVGFPRSETLHANMVTGVVGSPSNFNEWVGWKNRDRGMQQFMNMSFWYDDFLNKDMLNIMATGPPEYNEDFTQLTIKIREGMYWSDGVEFTAEDVAFTILFIKDNPGMNYNADTQVVKDAYAADKYTLVIDFTEPTGRFHTIWIEQWGSFFFMPKHVWEKVEDPLTFEYNPPLSLGTYELHSYDPAGMWTAWVRRDDWERTPAGILYGKPKPKYIVLRHIEEPAMTVIALTTYELDSAYQDLGGHKASLMMSEYVHGWFPDFPWFQNPHTDGGGIVFNTLLPPFDNKEVRWALTLAIDVVSYLAIAFDGAYGMTALHTPNLPLHIESYYRPMEEWLKNFTLDIGNGETFKPWDSNAQARLSEYITARGYPVPSPELIDQTLGFGWWKYAPDIAARMLENNGFSRDDDGNWLLPDGTPWKFDIPTSAVIGGDIFRSTYALQHEWRKFGIDATAMPTALVSTIAAHGNFDVLGARPARWVFGSHPDIGTSFREWHSDFVNPVLGEETWGRNDRWSDPRMDEIIEELARTGWDDTERSIELGIEGLKLLIEYMPTTPIYTLSDPFSVSTYYWTNWPTSDNYYAVPFHHWSTFSFVLPFLEATGN